MLAQPGSGTWGGGEELTAVVELGSVTVQQRAPPQPAVPLLFAEGPAALSPTETMAGACNSQQAVAVPRGGVAAGPVMLTPDCAGCRGLWQHPRVALHLPGEHL